MPRIIRLPDTTGMHVPDGMSDEQALDFARKTYPEAFAVEQPPVVEKPKEEPGFLSDTGNILKSGTAQGITGLGQLLSYTGLGGEGIKRYGEEMQQSAQKALSAGARESLSKELISEAAPGEGIMGYKLGNMGLKDIPAQALQSVPVMAATTLAGAAATFALPETALVGLGGATLAAVSRFGGPVAARVLPKLAGGALGTAEGNLVAGRLMAGTLSGNAAEGLAAAGINGADTEKTVLEFARTSPEQFFSSPIGKEALEEANGDRDKAIQIGAFKAGKQAAFTSGLTTAALATPGSAFEASLLSKATRPGRLGALASGAVSEGLLQEAPQSAAETYMQNLARIQAGENISPTKGVLGSAAQGALLGSVLGGGMGAVFGGAPKQATTKTLENLDQTFYGLREQRLNDGLDLSTATYEAANEVAKNAPVGSMFTVFESTGPGEDGSGLEATVVGRNETGDTLIKVDAVDPEKTFVLGQEFSIVNPFDRGARLSDNTPVSSLDNEELNRRLNIAAETVANNQQEFAQTKVELPDYHIAERDLASLTAEQQARQQESKEIKKVAKTRVKPTTEVVEGEATATPTETATAAAKPAEGVKTETAEPPTEATPQEVVNDYDVASQELSEAVVNEEATADDVVALAQDFVKRKLINKRDLADIQAMSDMDPIELATELNSILEANRPIGKESRAKTTFKQKPSKLLAQIASQRQQERFKRVMPRIAALVEARMKNLGLNKYIKPEILQSMKSGKDSVNGLFLKQIIQLAVSGKSDAQIMATLNHESIHAMHEIGMITDDEWANLIKIAKAKDWLTLFKIEQRYPELSEKDQLEEAIADAFSTYATGRSPILGYVNDRPVYVTKAELKLAGQPVGIINRILKILKGLKNSVDEAKVAKDIFTRIETTPIEATKAQPLAEPVVEKKPVKGKKGKKKLSAAPVLEAKSPNIKKNAEGKYVYTGKLPESFGKWFGDSVVKDADGYPLVMFHGTARNITRFQPKQAQAIFVTDNPDFAAGFSRMSIDYMEDHVNDFLTDAQIRKAIKDGANDSKLPTVNKLAIANLPLDKALLTGAQQQIRERLLYEMEAHANVLPIFVKAEKPFDYENKQHNDDLFAELKDSGLFKNLKDVSPDFLTEIKDGNWKTIENPVIQTALRNLGFDSFYVQENNVKNLAVYEPTQIKSAVGNIGTFDITNPDIRYSKAKRFATDNTAAYATKKEVDAVREILPMHPDSEEHMREKFVWDEKGTGDYKNERIEFSNGNKKLVVGKITVDDWIDRIQMMLSSKEITNSRDWYKNIKADFQSKFGDEWPKYMVSYLLGNKAESPRGALNNTLYVAEEIKSMTSGTRKGGLSDEQIRQIFKGEKVSLVGIGAKLYDFVDSALGKTTRSWMGNAIEGNSPFVVDRHTFRDSGRVDPALLSYIEENFGKEAASKVKLDTPSTGTVSSPQYEKITEWGNALSDSLNQMNYMGGNWTPLEAQAVGWMAMSRLTETAAGGTTEEAMEAMTKTVPVELDFGAGAPYNVKFKDWHDLKPDAKARVTYKVMREVADVISSLSGTKVRDFSEGLGGWGEYTNPNAIIRFLASDPTAEALTSMAAYLCHQTKVYAFHPAAGQTGDSVAFDISPIGNTSFTNEDIATRIWPEVFKRLDPVMGKDADGNPNVGFVQAKTPDGKPTIRIVAALPTGVVKAGSKKGQVKNIRDLSVAERKSAEDELVSKIKPAIQEALENIDGTYHLDYGRVKVVSSSNNWEENENGQGHRQGVVERFGPALQGRLDSIGVPRVEEAIQGAIEEEKSREGSGWERGKASVAPRLSTAVFGGQQIPVSWQSPSANRMDNIVFRLQNKFIDLKNIMSEINKTIGQVSDDWNAYQKEELYHGRVAKRTKDFLIKEVRPLLNAIKENNLTFGEVQDYLHNRHAEERNVQVAKIGGMKDKGSGIATADARRYLSGLNPAKKRQLDLIAKRIDDITKKTRNLMVSSDLVDLNTINTWEKTYKNYVPLNREDMDDSSGGTGIGQGFSVREKVRRAMGSTKSVEDILANVIAMRERTIVKAEKNRISKAIYGLALKAPNPGVWVAVDPELPKNASKNLNDLLGIGLSLNDAQNIAKEPKTRYISQSGFIEQRVNPNLRSADNVLHLMIKGKEKLVFFNPKNEVGNRLVRTLKNLDMQTLGLATQNVAAVTRWFASVNTQYNPIFGMINLLRDTQTAMFTLTDTPLAGKQTEVAVGVLPAMKGIWQQIRAEQKGQSVNSYWGKLFEEFELAGGPTGYREMFANTQDRVNAIQKEFKQLEEGKVKQAGRAIFDLLSDYNTALENAVRLSAYDAAKKTGMSKEKAASLAKNLTVNFNRKGDIAMQMGALYAFFNASVQGTARLVQTLKGPAGRRIIYGGLTLGVLQAMLLAAAGFDDDQPPQFVKDKNLIFPTGDGKYITIPMPLGFNAIPNISRTMTEMVLNGGKDASKKMAGLFVSLAESFNPLGSGTFVQTLTPTVLDPMFALIENRDSFGRRIAKEDMSGLHPTPGFTRMKETATPWSKAISKYINFATGGTYGKQGLLSPTPDQLDYLFGQATGGLGREIAKGAQTVQTMYTGEELPSYKIPLVSRFYGDTKESASQSAKYYENIIRINEHANEIKDLRAHPEHGKISDYLKDNPDARLIGMAQSVNNNITQLNTQKRIALEKDMPKERIKRINDQIKVQMERFNERVKAVQQ